MSQRTFGGRAWTNLDRQLHYFGLLVIPIYLWCAWGFTFAGKGTPLQIDPPNNLSSEVCTGTLGIQCTQEC